MSLANRHRGETAYIVGRGPSLLELRPANFGPGPVIALNQAIIAVRELGLPNPIYTMQKDGCNPHGPRARVPLRRCICPNGRMVPPLPSETVLLSAAESPNCFRSHPLRYVFDVRRDFGLSWHTMSAPVAVWIAKLMGCEAIVMLAHDAYTKGDLRRVDGLAVKKVKVPGYRNAGEAAARQAAHLGLPVTWVSEAA